MPHVARVPMSLFLGAVGDDEFGREALQALAAEGIDTGCVSKVSETASGIAMIFVNDAAENCIGVAPGANDRVSVEMIETRSEAIAAARIVLAQLEIPLASVLRAAEIAVDAGVPFVLNPAPAKPLPDDLIARLHCITPNAGEADALTGIEVVDVDSATKAGQVLVGRGTGMAVVTLGADGAVLVTRDTSIHVAADSVAAVDTTGAGDTFNGVFVAALNNGKGAEEAVRLAVRAAGIAVQRPGAIASIPTAEEYA